MRSIFLVHDKRLLGIILQELNDLVNKHGVLTTKQSHILQEGIAPTIISGSSELEELVRQSAQSNKIKDGFIVKPARLGDNEGIIFGRDLSAEQWTSVVMSLRTLGSSAAYVPVDIADEQSMDLDHYCVWEKSRRRILNW
ncbi:hypothetical protein ACN38_g6914 [Penicillium nordicum]|uniref:ATP-grasp domain-containing protein n=1 Tax=Penicillium nordicum TaxID=229535 RepID=A0A0M9WEV3_9EURO|nr:hypothetical protein ACN38_g6914 [Penicillium nordicum]